MSGELHGEVTGEPIRRLYYDCLSAICERAVMTIFSFAANFQIGSRDQLLEPALEWREWPRPIAPPQMGDVRSARWPLPYSLVSIVGAIF
jgi:hypothetical protein